MSDNQLDNNRSFGERLGDNLLTNTSGIFSAKPIAKYLSGARCTLKMNGKIIGFAFNIAWNINTSVTEINTIDDYLPYELAPKRIEVNGTIGAFRIPGSGPTQQLLQADILSFLHQRYVEIEVRDTQTDNLIFLTKKALITGRSENISTNDLAKMTLQFKAIGWADERTPKLPDGVGTAVDVEGTNPFTKLSNKLKDLASDLGF